MKLQNSSIIKLSGTYLFSKRKDVALSLKDHLLITLHSPSSSSTAVILQEMTEHRSDFIKKLDWLLEKYSALNDVDASLIQTKIFGSMNQFASLFPTLKAWLQRTKIPVAASQLGTSLPSEVVLDASKGKVGLRFPFERPNEMLGLLSTGTARNRVSSPKTSVFVTILSLSSVTRTLAKQCIEEEPSWEALCPTPKDADSLRAALKEQSSSVIILGDDLQTKPKLVNVIAQHIEKNPKVNVGWVGSHLPKEITQAFPKAKLLPPLEPFLLPHFKKMIKRALQESNSALMNETIPFESSKSKRRSR